MIVSQYLSKVFDPAKFCLALDEAIDWLTGVKFDTIAFRGMSGAMFGAALASRMGKSMILVRKDKESSHSIHKVEGALTDGSYIIVDDFVCSGKTLDAIVTEIHAVNPHLECVGLYAYSGHEHQYLDKEDFDELLRIKREYSL